MPAEWRQFAESLERQNRFDLTTPIEAAGTDRGFSTKQLREILADADIYDATCPRNPEELKQRMSGQSLSGCSAAGLRPRGASPSSPIAWANA